MCRYWEMSLRELHEELATHRKKWNELMEAVGSAGSLHEAVPMVDDTITLDKELTHIELHIQSALELVAMN